MRAAAHAVHRHRAQIDRSRAQRIDVNDDLINPGGLASMTRFIRSRATAYDGQGDGATPEPELELQEVLA